MSQVDIIGAIGVVFMLVAFFINLQDYIRNDHPLYITLNLVGSGFSCYASYMINYLPFVVLEGTWFLVSAWGMYVYFRRDFRKKDVPYYDEMETHLREFIAKLHKENTKK